MYVNRFFGNRVDIDGWAYEVNDPILRFNPEIKLCSELSTSPCNTDSDKVNIRFGNQSAFQMSFLKFNPSADVEVDYGIIQPGETSCYMSFDDVKIAPYSYSFVLGSEDFRYSNLSYFERLEERLAPGNYTFYLHIRDFNEESTRFSLVQD